MLDAVEIGQVTLYEVDTLHRRRIFGANPFDGRERTLLGAREEVDFGTVPCQLVDGDFTQAFRRTSLLGVSSLARSSCRTCKGIQDAPELPPVTMATRPVRSGMSFGENTLDCSRPMEEESDVESNGGSELGLGCGSNAGRAHAGRTFYYTPG